MRFVLVGLLVALLGIFVSEYSVVVAHKVDKPATFNAGTVPTTPGLVDSQNPLVPGREGHGEIVEYVFEKLSVGARAALRGVGLGERTVGLLGMLFDISVILPMRLILLLFGRFPKVFAALVVVVAVAVLPWGSMLRKGLNDLGFGPRGPVKGTVAAKLQRDHFGNKVPKDSWFAKLQQLGMKT